MASRLLASLFTAFTALAISSAFANVSFAQAVGPKTKQYQQRRMSRGIDDGMVRRAPRTGDEKMARKAPEHIDDGIFKPTRGFRTYKRTPHQKIDKR